jgi:hypothetical protein
MKGIWYMIEALMAGIILITFLVMLKSSYFSTLPQEKASLTAYATLKGLDDAGLLRPYAVAGDYEGLSSNINLYSYEHSVEICTQSGCSGLRPNAEDVWAGSYMISGDTGIAPRTVHLYLWRQT